MRLFIYVSRVPESVDGMFVPIDFRSIYQSSRKNNIERGINSIISYKFGHYLQVLEGPKAIINQTVIKILNDTRHRDIEILVDKEVESHAISVPGMSVEPNLLRSKCFKSIIERNSKEFLTLPEVNKQLLGKFFDLSYFGLDGLHDEEVFQGSTISLSSMPCTKDINVTPNIVRLANTLINSEKTLDTLNKELIFKSERELIESLSMLRKLGLIQLKQRRS